MTSSLFKVASTGFGLGYLPIFPGTVGTLLGIPLFFLFSTVSWKLYFLSVIAFTFLSIWIVHQTLPLIQDTKRPMDPRCIVLDEVAGYLWSAGLLKYLGFWSPEQGLLSFLLLSFFFFRLFDIVKWWPIRWVENRGSGAWGIVLDDVAAGMMAGFFSLLFCIVYPLVVHFFVSL